MASLTVTVYVVVGLVAAGMPVTEPVDVLRLSPEGRLGETLKLSGVVPPEPVTGVNEAAGWLTVSVVDGTAWVAFTALFTVSEKLPEAVAWLLSVTVMV